MGIFPKVEAFVQAHRSCGELRWTAPPPSPEGYRLGIACRCGVTLDCWVTPDEAEVDLLRTGLPAFPN